MNQQTFRPGDMVQLVYDVGVIYDEVGALIGKTAEVISELEFAPASEGPYGDPVVEKSHLVKFACGAVHHLIPRILRKIKPGPDWVKICGLNDIPAHVDDPLTIAYESY